MTILTAVLSLLLLAPTVSDVPDVPTPDELPVHTEEVLVVGDGPLVAPVRPGEPVRVVFGAGELLVEPGDVAQVRAEVELRCPPKRRARCGDVHKKLRVKAEHTDDGVVVRVAGVRANILKRYDVSAHVVVPRSSPLVVKAGFGAVRVVAGDRSVSVDMKVGDLRVFGRREVFSSASARARIGDASVREGREVHSRRSKLIGAKASWQETRSLVAARSGESKRREDGESIEIRLRIGDARVVLEDAAPRLSGIPGSD